MATDRSIPKLVRPHRRSPVPQGVNTLLWRGGCSSKELLEFLARASRLGPLRCSTDDLQLSSRQERLLFGIFILVHCVNFYGRIEREPGACASERLA
jgi:hypothetical protein